MSRICCGPTHEAIRLRPYIECRCDCHDREPWIEQEGTPWEHLFTVERAIRWAEIRTREVLGVR